MSEIIERVRNAIARTDDAAGTFEDMARAAIEAMREPTAEMIEAYWSGLDDYYPNDGSIPKSWGAMIDSALTPTPPSP